MDINLRKRGGGNSYNMDDGQVKILGKLKTKKLKWIINVQGLRSAICDFVSEVMFGLVVTFYPADAQGILQDMYVLNTALEMLADCELQ